MANGKNLIDGMIVVLADARGHKYKNFVVNESFYTRHEKIPVVQKTKKQQILFFVEDEKGVYTYSLISK